MFDIKKRKDSYIILATGAGWEYAPKFSDKIIYALNDYVFTEKYQIMPDILFIMDVLDEKPQIVSGINNLQEVVARINKMQVRLMAPFKYEEIPLSEEFPLTDVVKRFGAPYFTNTICYMIAYALMQGAKEIEIFGVNQASASEYSYEKAGVEYWLGIANGMGVKIIINGDKSELVQNKTRQGNILYGYNQSYEQIVEADRKFGKPTVKSLSNTNIPKSRITREIN